MSKGNIGIKVADGSFYPVLEEDYLGQKKLVLTTVRDNQETVQIDLYQGLSERAEEGGYVGTLVIENIEPAPKREPEIEVVLGVDDQGNLNVSANDLVTGERQSLSVSLQSLDQEDQYSIPEFEIEDELSPTATESAEEFEDTLLTGETYPIGPTDRRKEHLRHKRNPLAVVGFVLLGLILIAALAFFIFRSFGGPEIPQLFGGQTEPQNEQPAEDTASAAADTEAPQAEATAADTEAPQAEATEATAASGTEQKKTADTSYLIKRGDTLWDISATYYRNPWLYPRIARANRITDPDIIFAGQTIIIPQD